MTSEQILKACRGIVACEHRGPHESGLALRDGLVDLADLVAACEAGPLDPDAHPFLTVMAEWQPWGPRSLDMVNLKARAAALVAVRA